MRTIFKYQPGLRDRIEIETHESAELLSVQYQRETLTFWFLVDTDKDIVPHTFAVYGTGHEIDLPVEDMVHVATVQMGPLVWHVFEVLHLSREQTGPRNLNSLPQGPTARTRS